MSWEKTQDSQHQPQVSKFLPAPKPGFKCYTQCLKKKLSAFIFGITSRNIDRF